MSREDKNDQLPTNMTNTDNTKLCMACSKWVPEEMKSCHCGHVFKQVKSINGKRFTEGRFYQEAEDAFHEPKKKLRSSASIFIRERVTYMPGFTYEEFEKVPEKRERKKKRRKPIHLLNTAIKNQKNMLEISSQTINIPSYGFCGKDPGSKASEQPLIQVLQEINNKITNQRRLWIDLGP